MFPDIFWRTHWGNGLKIWMLIYPNHLQNWLDYGHSLLIFLILVLFWLSQIWGFRPFWSCSHVDFPHYGAPLTETNHIWGFLALSGECAGVNVEGGGVLSSFLSVLVSRHKENSFFYYMNDWYVRTEDKINVHIRVSLTSGMDSAEKYLGGLTYATCICFRVEW